MPDPAPRTLDGELARAIEQEVLRRISPDGDLLGRVSRTREALVARAEAAARKLQTPPVRPLVAGSAARGTFLRDRIDIDLFLLFPPELDRESLARHGLAIAHEILEKTEERYAEHPYLRGEFQGFAVDAVPGYLVADPSQPKSAVDRTPFHHRFLTERQTPAQVDQVRLTKQFLKSLGVYGSEARTAGFSGYLVELLVLRFGSLDALLNDAVSWRPPVNLASPSSAPRVPTDVALILDDPVDPHRNVASALSMANLALFLLAAKAYLERPSATAFETPSPRRRSIAALRKRIRERETEVVGLKLPRPKLVDDILFPQLRKAERSVSEEAERLGFDLVGSASAADRDSLLVLVEVASGKLPALWKHDGPPPGVARSGDFLDKWVAAGASVMQGPYVQLDGRLAVEVRRSERRIERLLTAQLGRLPLGKDLMALIGPSVTVQPLDQLKEGDALHAALTSLLEKRLPWLPELKEPSVHRARKHVEKQEP